MLKVPFTKVKNHDIRKYHINFIHEAIDDFRGSIYDELSWDLWQNEGRITLDTFNYFYKKNPQKTLNLTKTTLIETGQSITDELLDRMFNIILETDNDKAVEIIKNKIEESTVSKFEFYSKKASEIRSDLFVRPLLNRLEHESNAHIYLKSVEALISYGREDINAEILAYRALNPNLSKGWGGEALGKLLEEHGIE